MKTSILREIGRQ